MIDFANDLNVMINEDEFAVEVDLTPDDTNPTLISGIYDGEHAEIDSEGVTIISTYNPIITIRTVDENSVEQEDEILVNSVRYAVQDIQRDGTGVTILVLRTVG